MPIVRLVAVLVALAAFVLLAAYIWTRNKQYLNAMKQLAVYTAWFVVILVIVNLIARVIRL